ncbi:MAG: VWA domain-containing protein [Thermoanaerobaculia bacterium]
MRNRWLLGLAGLAWMTCAAGAQETDKPPVFGESLDVRVVNVEVVVTDRKGNRVTGLGPKDFRLEVDGKAAAVDYFTEVREGLAAAPAAPEAGGKEAPPAAFEPGEPVGTNYLVFIDDFFSLAIRRNEVLDTLRKDLSRLGPADRMSIVAWDGLRLKRLATWSASREGLAAALELAKRRPARGLAQEVKKTSMRRSQREQRREQEAIDAVDDVLRRILSPGSTLEELAYAQTVAAEISDAVNATVGAMRGSDPPAGRKVLLLLSGGWPFSLNGYVQGGLVTLAQDLPETRPILEGLTNTANLLGYTVYPIDVPGLTTVTRSADQSGREVIVSGPGSMVSAETPTTQPFAPSDFSSFEEQEIEGTLDYIARETGGKPLLNGNRSQALSSPAGDTRSYYWLGFSPGWARDNRNHKVRVKVLRDGLQARARKGFLDLSREAEVGMKVESAILFGEMGETGPLAVRAGAPRATKQKGLVAIPITLEIPADAVTLLRDGDGYSAKAILRLAAADGVGNRSEIPRVEIRLTSDQAPAAGQTLRYETQALLRGKASRIVAIVYDPLTGRIAAGETLLDRTAP